MQSPKALDSHLWSDSDTPRETEIAGRKILHHRCLWCARDFVTSLDGSGWHAAYIGILRVELLADSVNERWLSEECSRQFLASDEADRAMSKAN